MRAEKLKFWADDSSPTGQRQRAQTGAVSQMTDNRDCGNG